MIGIVHAITPGDHFSPRTGSAIPTVIHGLASGAARLGEARTQKALVAAGTYPDRYASMPVIEYSQRRNPGRLLRSADVSLGQVLGVRPFQRRCMAAMVADQSSWAPSFVLAHNLVQLCAAVDRKIHRPILYAHNDLFRTYRSREAARAVASASLIVCVSQFLADRVTEQLPGSLRDRVVVVPNAADCDQFSPAPQHRDSAHLKVAFVGRVIPDKGVDVLLRAVRHLDDPRVELTVIGSAGFDSTAPLTSYEQRLRRLAADLPGPIRFLPFTDRESLPNVLRSQDVLAVPSRWPEPWGLTVSEGQAAGLVVLASDVGGIPEAISDTSHLVPPGDAQAMAAQLGRFLNDRALLLQHKTQARAHAETHDWRQSWRVLAQHLEGVV